MDEEENVCVNHRKSQNLVATQRECRNRLNFKLSSESGIRHSRSIEAGCPFLSAARQSVCFEPKPRV